MQVVHQRSCGLDVQKKTVVACILITLASGEVQKHIRTFSTMTADLLADWLKAFQVTHVAMESTGVFWKPVFTLLQEAFPVILVDAQHMKAVPGRKKDMKDSEWIVNLLVLGRFGGLVLACLDLLRNKRFPHRMLLFSSLPFLDRRADSTDTGWGRSISRRRTDDDNLRLCSRRRLGWIYLERGSLTFTQART